MTGAEPTVERQGLGEMVLGIIGGYRMGTALNAQDLFMKTAPGGALPPDPVLAPTGNSPDGVHGAGDERGTHTLAT
jgi:hypothetical protein